MPVHVNKNFSFSDLRLAEYKSLNYSVYVLNFDWHFLYVNDFVLSNLNGQGGKLIGQNIWSTFPALKNDLAFQKMKSDAEQGLKSSFTTMSPLTGQKIQVSGQNLRDCFFFTSTPVPLKEDLIRELRREIR